MYKKTENISSYGYVVKNSGITVLDASIKMALKLYDAHKNLKNQNIEIQKKDTKIQFSEKRYRRLFEASKDGILILDANDGMLVDVNPYLIEMLGYSKEQFLNKHIWDIRAFKDISGSKISFRELQEKEYIRFINLPLETFDGKLIHVEFVSNVYFVDDEKVIQCNIRDITDRKIYEKELTDNIDGKTSLIKELQHRTKNSFSMITSLIYLRSKECESEETKTTLKDLSLRVRSISDLYTLLYDTDSLYDVQLKTYCTKVIASMLEFSERITINTSIEEMTVTAKNAAIIGMIIVELLSNATKYAFPESAEGIIHIELKKINSKLLLTIKDNGIGFKKDFDPVSTKTLGIHLVNLMVGQLNGTIQFTTDKGTKCSIICEA